MEEFNWEQLAWTSPILVAVMAGLFALFKAFADKRTNPVDEIEKVLKRYQALLEIEEARSHRSREREKQAFKVALELRAYSLAWESWYQDGMPDPPGRPVRPPNFNGPDAPLNDGGTANPYTAGLGLS